MLSEKKLWMICGLFLVVLVLPSSSSEAPEDSRSLHRETRQLHTGWNEQRLLSNVGAPKLSPSTNWRQNVYTRRDGNRKKVIRFG